MLGAVRVLQSNPPAVGAASAAEGAGEDPCERCAKQSRGGSFKSTSDPRKHPCSPGSSVHNTLSFKLLIAHRTTAESRNAAK